MECSRTVRESSRTALGQLVDNSWTTLGQLVESSWTARGQLLDSSWTALGQLVESSCRVPHANLTIQFNTHYQLIFHHIIHFP